MDWAISRDVNNGGKFLAVNVGSDRGNHRVRDLADAVATAIPGTRVSVNKDAQPDKRSYRVNFDLFKKLAPGHQPVVPLDQSIRELQAGLKDMDFRDPEFRSSKFMRLNILMELRKEGLLNDKLEWTRP